jgi:hypothetical protein
MGVIPVPIHIASRAITFAFPSPIPSASARKSRQTTIVVAEEEKEQQSSEEEEAATRRMDICLRRGFPPSSN